MLTKGQQVACDMTGLGHNVIGTYEGPIAVSAKFPEGGHRVRLANGKAINVRREPSPSNWTPGQKP